MNPRRLAQLARPLLLDLLYPQPALRTEYARVLSEIRRDTPDSPACSGWKSFSQCDEDGIIAEIFRRIGEGSRTFVEIGCGNGLENNTHALLLRGWSGAWIDGDPRNIKHVRSSVPSSPRLVIAQSFVTKSNALEVVLDALPAHADPHALDLLSIDIDGDEAGVLETIVSSVRPRVLCTEYNAKFPPPLSIAMGRRDHGWTGDDYHGSSLLSLSMLLGAHGYRLVCCNASGANAFFVRTDEAGPFTDYSVDRLYRPAAFELRHLRSGHPPSMRFLREALSQPLEY